MEEELKKKRPVKLVGEKVALGPVIREDLEKYVYWMNDIEVTQYLITTNQVMTLEMEEEWFKKIQEQKDERLFAILDKETLEPIGNTGLHRIDNVNRTATFGIFIGNKDYWGKGYGTDAGRLIVDYGFNILNLNNIILTVYGYNDRAHKAYEKIGFKEFGRLKEGLFFNGKYHDAIYMNILARDFKYGRIDKMIRRE